MPIRVLLVEDNDLMRNGLRTSFGESGFEVVGEAEDGVTAVELTQSLRPDVVVMDIGLPLQTGIEATRQIKQSMPDTKVVMLTSHNSGDELFAALAAGAAGYCLKDCASELVKIAVRSVSEGAAWLDPKIAGMVLKVFESGVLDKKEQKPEPYQVAPSTLSEREKDVLRLMVNGAANKEIASQLHISISTVRTHVEHILGKLAVSGRTAAAVKAMKEGLI
ncbi:MAG TPA: response regulator transcription factor [Planktothrix sp.]|jgi:DNA-binding NarL/FixJ family response regulator